MKLILASTSRYRRELLARLDLAFDCVAPGVDETALAHETPAALALRLSLAKARAVAERYPQAVVIGADQVAELDGLALNKPETLDRARAQLSACSGRQVVFHAGLAVVGPHGQSDALIEPTTVSFRALSEAEIERYLAREPALDSAGSFKSEALGITLFDALDSRDPTALVGLPLIALARLLRAHGLQLP